MRLIDLSVGKQKADIMRSGNIFADVHGRFFYRTFDYLWNKKKRKQMQSRVPFVMARTLKTTPDYTNTVLVMQTDRCNMHCWFCFVDDANKVGGKGRKKKPKEIAMDIRYITEFLQNRGVPIRVARISGGEPTLSKDIGKVADWIQWSGLGVWIDSNLAGNYNWLHNVQRKMLGMSLCLKGINAETAYINSSTKGATVPIYERQLRNLDVIYNDHEMQNIALYVIDAMNYKGTQLRQEMYQFYTDLLAIHPILPRKVEWLQLKIYSPTKVRMKGKELPKWVPYIGRDMWNSIIKEYTGKDYLYHLLMS